MFLEKIPYESIRIIGATTSGRAFLAAQYAKEAYDCPTVILCPTEELASEFQKNLECFFSSPFFNAKTKTICRLPTWEQSPYSSISPSIQARLERLATLSTLSQKEQDKPPVIITTLAASCQATLPQSFFEKHFFSIQINQDIHSREALSLQLLENGYLQIDPVEDPGTFAVRGEIIDIFPPNRPHPIRIELLDHIVEKIREFNPDTQKALVIGPEKQLTQIRIPPAREVLINQETLPILKENIKNHSDFFDIRRSFRDPILSSLREYHYPNHSDIWCPFAYQQPTSLWNYLPKNTQIIWNDEFLCLQEWDKFEKEQKKLSTESSLLGIIAPQLEQLFLYNLEVRNKMAEMKTIFLDRISLPNNCQKNCHPISMETNHELITKNEVNSSHFFDKLELFLQLRIKQGFKIVIFAATKSQLERIRFLIEERKIQCYSEGGSHLVPSRVYLTIGELSEGFHWTTEGFLILNETEILGKKHVKKTKTSNRSWSGLQALSDLEIDDTVVHSDHGIGKYRGITRLDLCGALNDFLLIEYANQDKLYLPIYRLNVIQKYLGSGESVQLDRLGSQHFLKVKEKVKETVKALAIDLIQLYALRKIHDGVKFSARNGIFQEFETKFPFDETPDQLKAIDDVLTDLESGKVMDRLICGDVGYGKTEVAIRAAFRVVSDGKQVVVLVPTTLLAQQHENSFKNRFKDYPFLIESISRFKTSKEQKSILEKCNTGKVDILIGTHRVLSQDVRFQNLGLIIVDEEHRFGVEHKEKLKTMKVNTHVLTLTATPIPRTLHMALSGLRDISLINTPPIDRLPIRTYVSKMEESVIKKAIDFEISRGGQVFFLHNRVQSIYEMAEKIQKIVPTAKIIISHGQMKESDLEKTMITFYSKEADILLCTSIIESGLDIPNANTIIVDRADMLGLAQLYQIRGRVGRGTQRGYAYLLIPSDGPITEEAQKRLEIIQRFVELGSGFSIASHDLELRGGGDLLGAQQSGSIGAVGFSMYTELLEEAIAEIKQSSTPSPEAHLEPEIKLPFSCLLDEKYIADVHQRLSMYRRLSSALDEEKLSDLEEEMKDRFGSPPQETQNLLWLIRIKTLLKNTGIETLTVGPEKISFLPGKKSKLKPEKIVTELSKNPKNYAINPDSKITAKFLTKSLPDLFFFIEKLIAEFS